MSDINLDFTVSNSAIEFTVQPNDITFTPSDIQLTVYTSGAPLARGANMEVQYNYEGLLEGDSNFTFDQDVGLLSIANIATSGLLATGNVSIGGYGGSNVNIDVGNVSNIKIGGGTNGYVLQTDGSGNLDWTAMTGGGGNGTPGGSNTQIQYNDAGTFGGNAGFTFNEVSGLVNIPGNLSVAGIIFGSVANANYAAYANISNIANTANSVAGANVSGQVPYAAIANSVAVANVVGIGNIATVNLTGSASNVLYGNGVFAAIGNITSANFANFAGNVTVAAQPNITSLGTLTGLTLGSRSIALGNGAVAGNNSVSIGGSAGATIGNAGPYANTTISIGESAGGGNYRGNFSVAIGFAAGGNLGLNSIAIGKQAAVTGDGLNYGNYTVINATGANLNPTSSNSFYVKPIRNATLANILYYNNTTGEITYDAGGNIGNPVAGSNTQVQFNNSNAFGASANFTFNSATNLLTVTGTVSATNHTGTAVSVSGNVTGGNIRTVSGMFETVNGNIYANNGYIIGGEGVFSGLRFVNTISANVTVSPIGISTASHKIPISINGTTYYILLTT